MAANDSIIDLTNSSYTLADHCSLNNVIINLDTDDSFCEVTNESNITTTAGVGRKRRYTRIRAVNDPQAPVHDLCTPENKNKRKSDQSEKGSENVAITKEPVEDTKVKKAKLQLGCCPICFDELYGQALASTKCGHVFCLECLKMAIERESRCPTCRTTLKGNSKYHPLFL